MKNTSAFASFFGTAATHNRNRTIDRSVVKDFNVDEFAGVWYEVARMGNGSGSGLSHVTLTFTVAAAGAVSRRTEGLRDGSSTFEVTSSRVSVPDAARSASMKVSGMPFTDREFNVLEVDQDYNFAMVGGGSANNLRILSRAPYIPDEDLGYLVARAVERGYDISKLIFPEYAAMLYARKAFVCAM